MNTSLGDLAQYLRCELQGDASKVIAGVADPRDAGPRELAPVFSKSRLEVLADSRAGALLVGARLDDSRPQLIVEDARAALARLLLFFHPEAPTRPGVDPSARLAAGSRVSPEASVGAFCVVEEGAVVEDGARLDPYVFVGAGAQVGRAARIGVRATLCAGVQVHAEVRVAPGAVIGGEGFGLWREAGPPRRIRSVGGVIVGEGAQVGANSCVDAGTLAPTRIGAGAQIDNLVQIGHNAELGESVVICAQCGVAGSAVVERGCELGGQVGIADHVVVGEGARIGAKSGVGGDVPPRATYSGYPAMPHGQWLRSSAIFGRLGSIWRKLRRLDG